MHGAADQLGHLKPASRIYLHYGVQDEPWHERLLGVRVGASRWVVATPTHDVYDEDILEADAWAEANVRGGAPPALRGSPLFKFNSRTHDETDALMEECRAYAKRWRMGEFVPPVPLAAAGPGGQLPLVPQGS